MITCTDVMIGLPVAIAIAVALHMTKDPDLGGDDD